MNGLGGGWGELIRAIFKKGLLIDRCGKGGEESGEDRDRLGIWIMLVEDVGVL